MPDERGPRSRVVISIVLAERRWHNNKDPQSPPTSWCAMGETDPLGPWGRFVGSRRSAKVLAGAWGGSVFLIIRAAPQGVS